MLPLAPGVTVAQARRVLADAFRNAGIDNPDLDARLLAGEALHLGAAALIAAGDRTLTSDESLALNALAERRMKREPVARILGRKEFWGLDLRVTPATLVPRPETETIVEAALAALDHDGPRTRALRIADLGTGTGALLLALLHELPHATGVGTDIDSGALASASDNAQRLGLAARASFSESDFGAALTAPFDLVVSNPPYIARSDLESLPPEVRFDPDGALDGGPDGLDAYRTIARQVRNLLGPGGHLVLELGQGQEGDVAAILAACGLVPVPAKPDLAGIPRALSACLPQSRYAGKHCG